MSDPIGVEIPPESLLLGPESISLLLTNTPREGNSKKFVITMATIISGYQVEKIQDFLEKELAKKQAEQKKDNPNPENPLLHAHARGKLDGQVELLLDLIRKLSE